MRIAQITDIHIGHEDDRPHGINARDQFLRTMEAICNSQPDQVVLSGDLSFREPNESFYKWIAGQLDALPCDVTVLAGNHDSQEILQKHFSTQYHSDTNEIYGKDIWDGNSILFLDTARGVMSETQYQWLDESLRNVTGRLVLFMHHPPMYCGVPHMDEKYAFREIPRIQEVLQGFGKEILVFCGHYHVERTIVHNNQSVYITPSTYFQIDSSIVDFGIDHHRPGFRLITIEAGKVITSCLYQ